MDAKTVTTLFYQLKQRYQCCRFGGVFMSDLLPLNRRSTNIFYVVNTLSTHSSPSIMGHYILIYVGKEDIVFFDSFGLSPANYPTSILRFLQANIGNKRYVDLGTRIQHDLALTCGAFVVYVAYFLCTGGIRKACAMLGRFSRDYKQNDRLVLSFLYRTFRGLPACKKTFCLCGFSLPACFTDCNTIEASGRVAAGKVT